VPGFDVCPAGVRKSRQHIFEEFWEMVKTIYVGNLPYTSSVDEVGELFARYGEVHSVNLISDRETDARAVSDLSGWMTVKPWRRSKHSTVRK
jgi:hypothetical protein